MPPRPRDLRERLMEKVIVLGPDECWQWTGTTNGNGYGRIWDNDRREKVYAHRASYELEHGAIADTLEIDHLCRNRGCVNPRHLEPVTRRVNQIRGNSVSGKNARKEVCVNGHPFTPENTYRPPTGGRQCAICRRAYRLAHSEQIRALQKQHRETHRDEQRAYKRAWRAKRKTLGLPHD